MKSHFITNIKARFILDSRGNPTIEVDVTLNNGILGRAAVPSGASTGVYEALELRDSTSSKFLGKGVLQAIKNINTKIKPLLINQPIADIKAIDAIMIAADGTPNKRNLGANSILGVSLAALHAGAMSMQQPLFQYINQLYGYPMKMPVPMMNILNGGSHADNKVDIQEFMIMPMRAKTFQESLRIGSEIFHRLKQILKEKKMITAVGDEGGFAPDLKSNEDALILLSQAISESGYRVGKDIKFALDVAASELYNSTTSKYELKSEKLILSSEEMIEYYIRLCEKYPIISIEDGLDENDWRGWSQLTQKIPKNVQIVGDDLTVTNPIKLQKAIHKKAMNAILIKLNQIGTFSETMDTIELAKNNNLGIIISHRSGETEDTTIADLSVAVGSGQIKTGSLCRTDRTCKYNQLLRIEELLENKK